MKDAFDVIVIGSGPGGYVAAIRCAQLGLKTACIEKDKELGGTCLNVGCIPSKALLHSSELLWLLEKEGKENGIEYDHLKCNFSQMMLRKKEIVSGFVKGIDFLFRKNKIERINGHGKLKDPNTVIIDQDKREIQGRNIILATGSEPFELPFLPFDEKNILSSTGALALEKIPKKMLVIGAGIIGVELGSVYNRIGSKVEFVEFLDRVAPSLDRTMSQHLEKLLTKQGMQFHLSHKALSAEKKGKEIRLTIEGPSEKKVISADTILVAIGRKPYSKNLGLEELGIEKDKKGFVLIDQNFRTKYSHIYAIGDLVEGPMLAHKASEEGVCVAEIIKGETPSMEYMAIPNVAYTNPEVAGVGLTEEKAKALKIPIKVGSFPFKANSRARCTSEEDGLVKIIAHATSMRVLGVHIIGAKASELIAEPTLAIQKKLTALDLAETCHAHPTLSEAIKEAALAATKGALHI